MNRTALLFYILASIAFLPAGYVNAGAQTLVITRNDGTLDSIAIVSAITIRLRTCDTLRIHRQDGLDRIVATRTIRHLKPTPCGLGTSHVVVRSDLDKHLVARAYPNPLLIGNLPLTIEVTGSPSQTCDILIYDLLGRLIHRTPQTILSEPVTRIVWDGHSIRDVDVQSGHYMVVVRVDTRTQVLMISLLK